MANKTRFHFDIMDIHDEVTGSCHLVIVKFPNGENLKFIVDAGLFQGQRKEEENKKDRNYEKFPFEPENVDFALITHVHVDHVGRLSFLVKSGYRNPIYATNITSMFFSKALKDCVKVLRANAKRKNMGSLYNEDDVDKTLELVKPCDFDEVYYVHKNVKVTFLKNGHLLGAAMILVQISYPGYEDINILFTGDYNNKNVFFDVPELPDWVKNLRLTIVQEATYGNMNSCEIEKCFEGRGSEEIEKKHSVIVPVFALGRAQELLYTVKQMQEKGMISDDIPIYLDGKLAIMYTFMYLEELQEYIKPEMRDFLPQNLKLVDKESRKELLQSCECKIILTTSGMGSDGPAQSYIPTYISNKYAMIHFTGYTPPDTTGGILKRANKGEVVQIGGALKKKFARVEYTTEFSSHAKADEMIEFLQQFNNLKLVLINHGEINVKELFAKRVLEEVNTKDVGILGEYFFRVDSYGLVKTMNNKFL